MISLGGLGAAPGGYQAAQARMFELQKQQQDQQAMAAYGQALAALAGQQGGQGPIPGIAPQQGGGMPQGLMPQAPLQGPAMPPGGTMQPNTGRFDDFNSGAQGGGPSPLLAALQARAAQQGSSTPSAQPPQSTTPTPPAQPLPVQGAATGGPLPPAPQQAAQPQQIRMPSTAGVQPGTLTWASIVNAVKSANPNIDPRSLAGAVNNFVPLMQNEQAQQWKAIEERRANYEAGLGAGGNPIAGNPNGPAGAYGSIKGAAPGRMWDGKGGQVIIPGSAPDVQQSTAEGYVDGWTSGLLPVPSLTQISSSRGSTGPMGLAISLAEKRGLDLYQMAKTVTAWTKMLGTANAPAQVQQRTQIDKAAGLLDSLKSAVDQWDQGNFPPFNSIQNALVQYSQNPAAMAQLKNMQNLITDLGGSFSQIFRGGVGTNSGFDKSAAQFDLSLGRQALDKVITQAQKNLITYDAAMQQVYANPVTGAAQPGGGTGAGPVAPPAQAGGVAPEGYRVQMPDGSFQVKKGGQWVKE